ncbi:MAG: Mur ligase family protein [Betaproteobacteria bacterium]|nr:Mur ligase family protein [Betaproteobacteria bacterium]
MAELLLQLRGARAVGAVTQPVLRVHTDSRTLRPGDLFVALRGERFDGHDWLAQARAAGAVAAVAERGLAQAGLPGVEVPDARAALGELAQRWRARFALPLIAVTGSNGKTTVTQLIAAMLRAAVGEAALATEGNFNNDIGVPLTLLRLRPTHRLAVLELGMNHPGEIAALAALAQPTVALVNNAQREHQEFMHGVEAVARENGSALAALPSDGVAVFPAQDAYTPLWLQIAGARRVVCFADGLGALAGAGLGRGSSVAGSDSSPQPSPTPASTSHSLRPPEVQVQAQWADGAWALDIHTPADPLQARLRLAGRHNVHNALAATACALAAGVPLAAIQAGLEGFEPVAGRSRALTLRWGARAQTLIDDSYNANPDSVRAAIDLLAELPGPRLLLLGDMGEVGAQALAFHDEVLRHALARGIEQVLVLGDWMQRAAAALVPQRTDTAAAGAAGLEVTSPSSAAASTMPLPYTRLQAFGHYEALQAAALSAAPQVASVLVKGSRFMRMERLVQALQAASQAQGGVQPSAQTQTSPQTPKTTTEGAPHVA